MSSWHFPLFKHGLEEEEGTNLGISGRHIDQDTDRCMFRCRPDMFHCVNMGYSHIHWHLQWKPVWHDSKKCNLHISLAAILKLTILVISCSLFFFCENWHSNVAYMPFLNNITVSQTIIHFTTVHIMWILKKHLTSYSIKDYHRIWGFMVFSRNVPTG